MAAVIDIVNRALTKIGSEMVTSLDDPGKAAKVATALYETVRDSEISLHNWHFAKGRDSLPALAKPPAFGWAHQYLLPSDCLRVLLAGPWPFPDTSGIIAEDRSAWALEGPNILTNYAPPLNIIYLRCVKDAGFYPPAFVEALACKLAIEMCEVIVGSNSKRELAWKEYDEAIRAARRLNAIQLPPQPMADGEWPRAHYQGVM